MKRFTSMVDPGSPLSDLLASALELPLAVGTSPDSPWLGLDNWKTLFRATFPEPILQFQQICGYKADSNLSTPDPEFMHVCLTTASARVRNALRLEKRLVEEDPAEFLWLVQSKLGFEAKPGAERALARLVEDERNGLCKFLDVSPELKRFREMGLKLAFVSNVWPFPLPQIFNEEGGISVDDFDQLILSYEVGHAKPSTEFYRETLRRCGTSGSNFTMVGDNPDLDIRGALNCGMHAVHIDRCGDCGDRVPGIPVIRKLRHLYTSDAAF